MVVGTGIDIIEVDRIQQAVSRQAFLDRIFTPDEQAYFAEHGQNAETIAGTFAAKEATAKALAAGFNGIRWTDIEILREFGHIVCCLYLDIRRLLIRKLADHLEQQGCFSRSA